MAEASPNMQRWYLEISSLMTEEQASCSFCQKSVTVPLLRVMIAAAQSQDALIECESCQPQVQPLRYFEDKLKDQKFIKSNFFVDQELSVYEKEVKPLGHLVKKFSASFPKLTLYISLMDYLTKQESVICQSCQRKFDLLRFENLIFGINEDA